MKRNYNKKGLLLPEETLKVVLAVLCLTFLAILLYSIYNAGKKSEDLGFATESVNFFVQEIRDGKTSVDIYNPSGWYLTSWPYGGEEPLSCSKLGWTSCICICEKNDADSCDSKGICINTKEKFQIDGENIEIKNPPITLTIDYSTKKISEA
jgi:hypothetical protein